MSCHKVLSIVVCGMFSATGIVRNSADEPPINQQPTAATGSLAEAGRDAANMDPLVTRSGNPVGNSQAEKAPSIPADRLHSETQANRDDVVELHARETTATAELTTEKILAGLSRAEARIRNLAVTTKYVQLQKFDLPVEEPVRVEFVTKFVVDNTGRSWQECFGERVDSRPNRVEVLKGHWLGSFDGKVAKSLSASEDGKFDSGRMDNYPSYRGVFPLEFTTHYFQKPVSAILKKSGAVLVGEAEWEGRPVTLVETPPVNRTGDITARGKYQFLIDPTRDWIVVRRSTWIQYGADQEWQEYTHVESSEHKEIRPGIWLPMRVKYESLNVTKSGNPELLWSFDGRNEDWKVNQNLPESQFNITFPPGVVVTDWTASKQRSSVATGPETASKSKEPEKPNKKPDPIYNPDANAKADIVAALVIAKRHNKRVLVQFGGNWCGWCFKLHDVFTRDGEVAPIVRSEYVLVMVDVNTNRELLLSYGKDNDKHGSPFLTVLDADGKVLTNQNTSDLERGPEHDIDKVKSFLQKWAPDLVDAEDVFKNALARAEVEKKLLLVHLGAPW